MDTAQDIIKALQERHGLTDQAIAMLVDSTQPTIWRLRNGHSKDCAASLYVRLSGALARLANSPSAEVHQVVAG